MLDESFCDHPRNYKISKLAKKVEKGQWALADFQRDFVWKWENIDKFLQSLYLGVPIGIIYTWGYKTGRPKRSFNKLEKIVLEDNKIDKLVIDGQQRMTFLSWFYMSKKDPNIFPTIAFNVKEDDIKNFFRKVTPKNPLDHSKGEISLQKLISLNGLSNCKKQLKSQSWYDSDKHGDKIDRMRESVYDRKIATQNVKADVGRDWALFIFDRVNREGKQLSEVDLVESILISHWADLFDEVRNLTENLEKVNKGMKNVKNKTTGKKEAKPDISKDYKTAFSRNAIIRSMLYQLHSTTRRDETKLNIFKPLNSKNMKLTEKNVKDAFNDVKNAMESLKEYIVSELKFNSLSTFSYLTVVVATQYLIAHETSVTPRRKKKMLTWFCIANINQIYTGGSTYVLADEDCRKAILRPDCWELLIETIQREKQLTVDGTKIHNLLLKPQDFGVFGEKVVSSGVVKQLTLTQLEWYSSEDWMTSHSLGKGAFNKLESHHIFPKSKFEKNKLTIDFEQLNKSFSSLTKNEIRKLLTDSKIEWKKKFKINKLKNILEKEMIPFWKDWGDANLLKDHLMNRAWIIKRTNNKISNKDPLEYLTKLDERRLEQQGVPTGDNKLYNYEKYNNFIEKRTELQQGKLNEILIDLWEDKNPTIPKKPTDKSLLKRGEGQYVEFKASFQWSFKDHKKDGELIHDVARAICAMLNSGGGKVFVGIEELTGGEGKPIGLEKDLKLFSDDEDKFDTGINSKIESLIKPKKAFQECVTPEPHKNKGKLEYYCFTIDGYHQYVKQKKYRSSKKNVIWIRQGKSTKELDE
jgi:uncharacterized protein with ParB-like and HNH nuclease domain